ncbi:lipid A-modifier LpxR family protein [Acidocella sp. MX-AZ03]|uniref:lipid A-modifier LpxR family protein n=1 Tax=Acidocella sp. MX-AZ03 TaxID=2697363 RepID=UPI003FA49AD6
MADGSGELWWHRRAGAAPAYRAGRQYRDLCPDRRHRAFRPGAGFGFRPGADRPAAFRHRCLYPTRPFVWYVFGGALGRFVAHDMLVQGNDFRSSRGVGLTHLQGDLEVGLAVIYRGVRLSAVETFETPEFHGSAPAFQYGSIAISTRF